MSSMLLPPGGSDLVLTAYCFRTCMSEHICHTIRDIFTVQRPTKMVVSHMWDTYNVRINRFCLVRLNKTKNSSILFSKDHALTKGNPNKISVARVLRGRLRDARSRWRPARCARARTGRGCCGRYGRSCMDIVRSGKCQLACSRAMIHALWQNIVQFMRRWFLRTCTWNDRCVCGLYYEQHR